ncbi:hypothetical protein Hanom_Chr14g01292931 [Helianthus anomalus]
MESNEEVVLLLETIQNPKVWSHYELGLMSDNMKIARCKYYQKFLKVVETQLSKKHMVNHCSTKKAK